MLLLFLFVVAATTQNAGSTLGALELRQAGWPAYYHVLCTSILTSELRIHGVYSWLFVAVIPVTFSTSCVCLACSAHPVCMEQKPLTCRARV